MQTAILAVTLSLSAMGCHHRSACVGGHGGGHRHACYSGGCYGGGCYGGGCYGGGCYGGSWYQGAGVRRTDGRFLWRWLGNSGRLLPIVVRLWRRCLQRSAGRTDDELRPHVRLWDSGLLLDPRLLDWCARHLSRRHRYAGDDERRSARDNHLLVLLWNPRLRNPRLRNPRRGRTPAGRRAPLPPECRARRRRGPSVEERRVPVPSAPQRCQRLRRLRPSLGPIPADPRDTRLCAKPCTSLPGSAA